MQRIAKVEMVQTTGHIPRSEVDFHPHSFGDPDGRLFSWRGQLYRGISSQQTPFFAQLLKNGVIQSLVDRGLLIETEPTALEIDGYGMVVRHRCVPFASYPNEWCAPMFKDAALTILDLVIELAQRGMTLRDAHPWNLLFDGCKPVYVDLTSIVPFKDGSRWPAYEEFCRFCLHPLVLMSHGQDRIARCLLPEYEGVLESDLLTLIGGTSRSAPVASAMSRLRSHLRQRAPGPVRSMLKTVLRPMQSLGGQQSRGPKSLLDFLEQVRRETESITLPSFRGEPSDCYTDSITSLSSQHTWTAKQTVIYKLLTQLQPRSVLDIGSNTGWYSSLAALLGSAVVSFDTDSMMTTKLYYNARDTKSPILPLVMDFTKPTPSRGISSHWLIAATERFACEMVLALDLVHQVVFERYLNFEQVVEGLAGFSKQWLIVEFIARDHPDVSRRWSDRFNWYTLDNFISALKKRFRTVSITESDYEPGVLLLCEK